MKKRILSLLIALCLSTPAWAAGTCVVSNVTSSQNASSRVPDAETVIVTVTCTADAANGSFPATTVPLTGSYPSGTILNAYNLTGYILYEVGRTPGSPAPTANYTTTITDSRGFAADLALMTTNGSATTPQLTPISLATAPYPVFPVIRGPLTVALSANLVNSAKITLDLIFRTHP